jgi:hypothetical protein
VKGKRYYILEIENAVGKFVFLSVYATARKAYERGTSTGETFDFRVVETKDQRRCVSFVPVKIDGAEIMIVKNADGKPIEAWVME